MEPKIQAARDGDLEALQQLLVIIISSCLFIGDMVLVAVACSKKTCRCHGVSSFLSEFATVDGQDPTDRLGWLNFRDSGILLISTDQQLEGILSHFSQFEVGGGETYSTCCSASLGTFPQHQKRSPSLPLQSTNATDTLEQWSNTQVGPRP